MTLCLHTPDDGYQGDFPPRCILDAGHPPETDHAAHPPHKGPADTWPNETEDAA